MRIPAATPTIITMKPMTLFVRPAIGTMEPAVAAVVPLTVLEGMYPMVMRVPPFLRPFVLMGLITPTTAYVRHGAHMLAATPVRMARLTAAADVITGSGAVRLMTTCLGVTDIGCSLSGRATTVPAVRIISRAHSRAPIPSTTRFVQATAT